MSIYQKAEHGFDSDWTFLQGNASPGTSVENEGNCLGMRFSRRQNNTRFGGSETNLPLHGSKSLNPTIGIEILIQCKGQLGSSPPSDGPKLLSLGLENFIGCRVDYNSLGACVGYRDGDADRVVESKGVRCCGDDTAQASRTGGVIGEARGGA